jgi:NTP pyrophosphatase (non-canonical NTP hydrolase)
MDLGRIQQLTDREIDSAYNDTRTLRSLLPEALRRAANGMENDQRTLAGLRHLSTSFRAASRSKQFDNFPSMAHVEARDVVATQQLAAMVGLIAGEAHEAIQELRKNDLEKFWEEIADVLIRVLDLCGEYDIDIGAVVNDKMDYNATRPPKHGKVF